MKGLRKPNRFEIESFILEYQELTKSLLDEISKYGANVIYTMKDKGVSKDFDFPDMARATFERQLETILGGIKAEKEAKKILNNEPKQH